MPYPYLLVEGDDLDAGPRHPNAIRGALLAVADAGITPLRSRDPDDSAAWINRLALRHARRTGASRTHQPARTPRPPPFQDPRVGALAAVPGISPGTAQTLLDHYGSIERLIAAGPDHWATINGIGTIRTHALATTLLDREQKTTQPDSPASSDPPT